MNPMKLTDEQTTEVLKQVQANLVQRIAEAAAFDLEHTIQHEISGIVRDWVAENIVPELTEKLEANKQFIVEGAFTAAQGISEKLCEALVTMATESLGGYRKSRIFKELFDL